MDGQVSLLNKKLSEAPNDKKTSSYKVYIEGFNLWKSMHSKDPTSNWFYFFYSYSNF